ncbi:sialate O-acetylesterase [Lewinella sp. IMCC34183]|uniref:sialate O-acetylesterase n=1 Tax=Lewinella sp. IMCC34183 TaxID=2248762 RepID=UPI0018E52DD4|nr:sialate O-acetylesterase [Lewinella sp. IMCC34183]
MHLFSLRRLIAASAMLLLCSPLPAQVRLPRLISDGMVLQRDQDLTLWGWASPGERIQIEVAEQRIRTRADENGRWSAALPAQPAGGPFEMRLSASNELTVSNIMFGDVWVCSGQSNMTVPLERVKEVYPEDIAAADYPAIREFFVPTMTELSGPREDFPEGSWQSVTPETVMPMSAIGFFFARRLYETYGVPIGIINTAVGGTPIEAWTSAEGLREFPELERTIERNRDTAFIRSVTGGGRAQRPSGPPPVTDEGLRNEWYSPDYSPQGWQTINIPGYWEDQGISDLNGSVWYRREVDIPAAWAGQELKLFMGRIVDADVMYVNGQEIGNITYQYPPRRYTVPAGLLKAGKNLFVVRVMNYGGKGGFVPDKPYVLTDGRDSLDLKGTWEYKVGEVFAPRSWGGGGGGFAFSAQNQPAALYNAMMAPITSFGVRGFTWYQGESNVGRAQDYYDYLPALITDWRAQFGQGELPFLTVQLANFQDATYLPVESQWAVLRDAQLQSLALPNTGVAVTTDIGEWNDIHPLNKLDVAERLALEARHVAYGEDTLTYSGPRYRSAIVAGDSVRIRFDQTGAGLTTTDGLAPQYFAIAGYDRRYTWAKARIEGDEVVVWSEEVSDPRFVRYAWADNPVGANLTNETGIPASPFQTDSTALHRNDLWRGKAAAVVLTYDDAIVQHLDNALPVLDSLNLKGTFYLTAGFPGAREHIDAWRRAARNGHELGNHTVYHPCDATPPGREWVAADQDLSQYTTEQLLSEIDLTNAFLEAIDGQTERTFAYTCGDTATADGSFKEDLYDRFTAARGTTAGLEHPATADLYNLKSYVVSGQRAEELIAWVENARRENALITFLFHGVGGGNGLNVANEEHRKFLEYLYRNQDDLWVTTAREAAKQLREHGGPVK